MMYRIEMDIEVEADSAEAAEVDAEFLAVSLMSNESVISAEVATVSLVF